MALSFWRKNFKMSSGRQVWITWKMAGKDIFLIGVKNGTWSHHAGNLILKLLRRRLITFYFDMTIIWEALEGLFQILNCLNRSKSRGIESDDKFCRKLCFQGPQFNTLPQCSLNVSLCKKFSLRSLEIYRHLYKKFV